jgi:hypothetical protein
MSTLNWKVVKTPMGEAVGIRDGEHKIIKETFLDEDQFHVFRNGKLIAVCCDSELAKRLCEPVPELEFASTSERVSR